MLFFDRDFATLGLKNLPRHQYLALRAWRRTQRALRA